MPSNYTVSYFPLVTPMEISSCRNLPPQVEHVFPTSSTYLAATGGVLWFSKISQNSQENTWARVSFLIKLQASGLILIGMH